MYEQDFARAQQSGHREYSHTSASQPEDKPRAPSSSSVELKNVNLYEVLEVYLWLKKSLPANQVPKDATTAQIKKAYHKLAVRWHPDKVSTHFILH